MLEYCWTAEAFAEMSDAEPVMPIVSSASHGALSAI